VLNVKWTKILMKWFYIDGSYPNIPGGIGDVQDDVDDLYDTSKWVNGQEKNSVFF